MEIKLPTHNQAVLIKTSNQQLNQGESKEITTPTPLNTVTFIVGNGFNAFISNYLKNDAFKDIINEKIEKTQSKEDKAKWIEECTQIMYNYCHLLDDIAISDNPDIDSGEYLLSKLSRFCDIIGAKDIISSIEIAVSNKIQRDMEEKSSDIDTDIPKTVRTALKVYDGGPWKYKSFSDYLFQTINKCYNYTDFNVYTTNYDKIVREAFRKYPARWIKESEIIKSINYQVKTVALHGEYGGDIICSSPDSKREKIDPVLLNNFETNIKNSKVIILFGLGLSSDPHILSILNKVKNQSFIIIDTSKEKYLVNKTKRTNSELGYDFLFNNDIYFLNTLGFNINKTNRITKPIETPEELANGIIETFQAINN